VASKSMITRIVITAAVAIETFLLRVRNVKRLMFLIIKICQFSIWKNSNILGNIL
jgi:hypothetical protein